jgi:hypothetical protein
MRAVLRLDLSVVGVGIVVTQLITPIAVAIRSLSQSRAIYVSYH